ncbi:MAG: putative sugar O-methyltransferase [Gemmataceae bacterium]
MKVGPVHVIRDATFQRLYELHNLWERLSGQLRNSAAEGNTLATRVLEHTHGLQHSPLYARMAGPWFSEGTNHPTADLAAAERIIRAYHRSLADRAEPPTPSMWDRIRSEKKQFLRALEERDAPTLVKLLQQMFTTPLTWGLGQVDASHPELLKNGQMTHLHFHFTDNLVSLAEAIGVCRVTAMMQDTPAHLQALNRDLIALLEAITAKLGFPLDFPALGSAYGFILDGHAITIDALTHAYTASRLRQLGATTAFELGGGYGCLALMAHRAGILDYRIYDLPWVNALQGYFLIRSLPEGTVRLYGETTGRLEILPYWKLAHAEAQSCDVLVNTDSLPEMGDATARAYLPQIQHVVRKAFLSINQEAQGDVPGVGRQNCVREMVEQSGLFEAVLRQRHWMRSGYVEEVFTPRQ